MDYCLHHHSTTGPLTSFLDADSDLSTPLKPNMYNSGPSKPPSSSSSFATPSPHAPSSPRPVTGGKRPKFTENELKVLRCVRREGVDCVEEGMREGVDCVEEGRREGV